MRVHKEFNIPQILATAAINYDNLRRFVAKLEAGGYLVRVSSNVSGHAGSYNQYRLVRNSGPKVPVTGLDGRVYDPNLDRVFEPTARRRAKGARS